MQVFVDDAEMDAQLGRTLVATHARAADLGEALATAGRVTSGDDRVAALFEDLVFDWLDGVLG